MSIIKKYRFQLVGLATLLAYASYLLIQWGPGVLTRHIAIPSAHSLGEPILMYPYGIDLVFLGIALWTLHHFIRFVSRLQDWMLSEPLDVYYDIYLVGFFSVFSLVTCFLLMKWGLGLGAACLLAFAAASVAVSLFSRWTFRRIQGMDR